MSDTIKLYTLLMYLRLVIIDLVDLDNEEANNDINDYNLMLLSILEEYIALLKKEIY